MHLQAFLTRTHIAPISQSHKSITEKSTIFTCVKEGGGMRIQAETKTAAKNF